MPTPTEMAQRAAQAGLTLNAGQMADLALAWRQLVGLIARIPRDRPLLDDQAYVFRLPPPSAQAEAPARKAAARVPAKPKAQAKAKAKAPAKAKAASKAKATANAKAGAKPAAPRRTAGRRA